jgi:hypothetical protein
VLHAALPLLKQDESQAAVVDEEAGVTDAVRLGVPGVDGVEMAMLVDLVMLEDMTVVSVGARAVAMLATDLALTWAAVDSQVLVST